MQILIILSYPEAWLPVAHHDTMDPMIYSGKYR